MAIKGNCVVGTTLAGYDGHKGWFYAVAVQPELQKSGIARLLVAHAEDALRELGCVKLNLQILGTNHAVAGFYENLGYAQEPRISMGKLL